MAFSKRSDLTSLVNSRLTVDDIRPFTRLLKNRDESVRELATDVIKCMPLDHSIRKKVKLPKGVVLLDDPTTTFEIRPAPSDELQRSIEESIRQILGERTPDELPLSRKVESVLEEAIDHHLDGTLTANRILRMLDGASIDDLDYEKLIELWERSNDHSQLRTQIAWLARSAGTDRMVREIGTVVGAKPEKSSSALQLMQRAFMLRDDRVPPVMLAAPPPPEPPGEKHLAMAIESEAEARDLPREFYGFADAPTDVVVAEPFTLTVGITAEAPPDVDSEPIVRPPSSQGEYTIILDVHASGFQSHDGRTKFELPVTFADPWPTVEIGMYAETQREDQLERTVLLYFSIDGQTVATLTRKIVTHVSPSEVTTGAQRKVWQRVFSLPSAEVAPDLTIMITDDGSGSLLWSFITPHKEVIVPASAAEKRIGEEAKKFTDTLMLEVKGTDGTSTLVETLAGLGKKITAASPAQLWLILRNIAELKAEPPTVLIITNDPYIPWELALVKPPLKPGLPPFLGAQVAIGRWLISEHLPPPRSLKIEKVFAVSGEYNAARWPDLEHAREEAAAICASYDGSPVEATVDAIKALLQRDPPGDLLHFSMHGASADASLQNGLITVDGTALLPDAIGGALALAPKPGRPFVFLNACQVATGSRVLGDYSGTAAEFVRGGATAVIAPLWRIDDAVAKGIALEFYKATLQRNEAPAEVLRQARAKFAAAGQPPSSTYLAYQYFGHPSLQLQRI